MPRARVNGIPLHYERSGGGEPLLLITGFTISSAVFEPVLELYGGRFDCITYDNRGSGRSGAPLKPTSMAELAADAAGLLEAIGVESAHVCGLSMGGMIAQELALAHPQRLRSLTLGCTYCGGEGSQLMPRENVEKLAGAMSSGNRDTAIRASYEINLSPAFRAAGNAYAAFHEMATKVPAAKKVIEVQAQAIFGHDTSGRIGEISTPTLIVHGTEDGVLPFPNGEQIAALMPQARFKVLEGVGHMFWWEQPQRSAELIREHALAVSA